MSTEPIESPFEAYARELRSNRARKAAQEPLWDLLDELFAEGYHLESVGYGEDELVGPGDERVRLSDSLYRRSPHAYVMTIRRALNRPSTPSS